MKYKAIFSDFDGTLYRDDYTISEVNKQAIKDYVNNGGKFILATGRLYQSIAPIAKSLGLDEEIIVYQGAGIYNLKSGKLLHSDCIDKEMSLKVSQFLDEQDDVVALSYIDDNCYCSEDNEFVEKFANICNIPYYVTGKPLHEYVKEIKSNPMKYIALVDEKNADDLVERAKKVFKDSVTMCKSKPFIVEFLPTGINKGRAVKEVCKDNGWNINNVIAVGDSENDISMIETAGLGIATGNAFEQTKAKADFISKTNDEDAIAQIIYKFCLNKGEN